MAEPNGLPKYRDSLGLGEFLGDLRACIWSKQSYAVRHFGLNHATLSRYESGKSRPELGYLASLAQLVSEDPEREQDPACRKQLLHEVNRVVRAHYTDSRPFQSWDELERLAAAYMSRRQTSPASDPWEELGAAPPTAEDAQVLPAHEGQPAPSHNGRVSPDQTATPVSQSNTRADTAAPHLRQQHNRQAIHGDHNQAVIGPVNAPVNQYQTQHYHHYSGVGEQHAGGSVDDSLFWICLLLVGLAGFWLIQTAPGLSIGTLLALGLWRTGRNAWRLIRFWEQQADTGNAAWYVGHLLAWLGSVLWSVVLLGRVFGAAAGTDYSAERLKLVAGFVGLSGYIFWLCTVDVLLWTRRSGTARWPWRHLHAKAAWAWQQRWFLLGLSWLMLAVFSAAMLFTPF